MAYISQEQLIARCPSLYQLVLGAAERANEIMNGATPLVKTEATKPTTMALEEIAEGKVQIVPTSAKKAKVKKEEV